MRGLLAVVVLLLAPSVAAAAITPLPSALKAEMTGTVWKSNCPVPLTGLSPIIEATGSPGKVEALLAVLAPYGIRELARTGRVGLDRGPSAITDHEGPGVPGPRAAVPQPLAHAS